MAEEVKMGVKIDVETNFQQLERLKKEIQNAKDSVEALGKIKAAQKKGLISDDEFKSLQQYSVWLHDTVEGQKEHAKITEVNKKAIEEKLEILKKEQATQSDLTALQRSREDILRQKGGIALLKSELSPNTQFNKRIEASRKQQNVLQSEINSLDNQIAQETDSEKKANLIAKKEETQKKLSTEQAKGSKMIAAQTAMNSAVGTVKKLGNIANGVFKAMGIDLKKTFSDVIQNITNMLKKEGIASYSTGNTLFTNAAAREQQMKYGLSNSANYALSQTMEMLNMKSDDDLMYMNENQKAAFNNIMDKYKTWYTNLESTGAMVKLQEAQLEFSMFKQELSYKLLNWFADHKDVIFTTLELTMKAMTFIAKVVEKILNLFGKMTHSSTSGLNSSDYLNNTNNNSNVNNVTVYNNNNANVNSNTELGNTLDNANTNLIKQITSSLSHY